MKSIVLASKNPVKIVAVRKGFERMFPGVRFKIHPLSVSSEVNEQPRSDREAYLGAHNRVKNAVKAVANADYWVGIEGGIENQESGMAAFAWVVILASGNWGRGRTGTFYLPKSVAELIHRGKELGEADDIIFSQTNSKQESGAVGLLTNNAVDRAELYAQAVVLALIPFCNPTLYN